MAKFVFCYRAPQDYVPFQPGAASAWTAWFEGMGAGLVSPGQPVGEARRSATAAPGSGSAATRWLPPTTSSRRWNSPAAARA